MQKQGNVMHAKQLCILITPLIPYGLLTLSQYPTTSNNFLGKIQFLTNASQRVNRIQDTVQFEKQSSRVV